MKLDIIRTDPTGNATILVLTSLPAELRSGAARRLMELSGGWAEQVGFVSQTAEGLPRLDMMGGEFCGNATLSLAACRAERLGLESAELYISVSGARQPVRCAVSRRGGDWRGEVEMPAAESVERAGALPFAAVRFPGVTHVVVPAGALDRAEAERAALSWTRATGSEALGVLLFDESALSMEPLVYVAATESAVWERGCASGTAAIGAYLAFCREQDVSVPVSQPGGVICARAGWESGRVSAVSISGGVRILGEDTAEVPEFAPEADEA